METGKLKVWRAKWRQRLRDAGLRCTEQRLAVLLELENACVPISHREIMDRVGHLQWDQATTFRNLNDLCVAGILTRFDVGTIPGVLSCYQSKQENPSDTLTFSVLNADRLSACWSFLLPKPLLAGKSPWVSARSTMCSSKDAASSVVTAANN